MTITFSLVVGCSPPGTCARNADCLGAELCDPATLTCVSTLGGTDGGSDARNLAGAWSVDVTLHYGGGGFTRTRHSVVVTQSGSTVSFAAAGCTLRAAIAGAQLSLLPDQSCVVPVGTALQRSEAGAPFSNYVTEFCYALGTTSSASTTASSNAVRFVGVTGGVQAGGTTTASCSNLSLNRVTLDFDFTR